MEAVAKAKKDKKHGGWKNVFRHWELYAMMLPGMIYLIINNYIPMAGLVVHLKNIIIRTASGEAPGLALAILNSFLEPETPG